MTAAVRVRVEGTVQGVGFRPYVFRLASELALGGHVLNDERGVLVQIEGDEHSVATFVERLPAEAPPLARVERVATETMPPTGARGFAIAMSERRGPPAAAVTPDSATGDACLAEVFAPTNRRFRYPFTNCTNCGPRFTIVRGVPYDRPLTTMAGFEMCAACRAEYDDPADRRFHAQPIACPDCGPTLRVAVSGAGSAADPSGAAAAVGPFEATADPLGAIVAVLGSGAVVAIKGLGGLPLACVASDEAAVAALRARKHREDKPFALM